MKCVPLNVSEDRAQALAGNSGRLIRPNHHDLLSARIAPCFDGPVASSDNKNALGFDRDLCSLLRSHRSSRFFLSAVTYARILLRQPFN